MMLNVPTANRAFGDFLLRFFHGSIDDYKELGVYLLLRDKSSRDVLSKYLSIDVFICCTMILILIDCRLIFLKQLPTLSHADLRWFEWPPVDRSTGDEYISSIACL